MIDRWNFFDQPVKNNFITHEKIQKISTCQEDDNTIGCLLDYPYFRNYYKMIAIDLSKQQAVGTDPKSQQQIIFTASLEGDGNTTMFSLLKQKRLF